MHQASPNPRAGGRCKLTSLESCSTFEPAARRVALTARALRRPSLQSSHIRLILPPAQPHDDSACPGEQSFIKRHELHMTAIAHRVVRRIELAERCLGHAAIPTPLGNKHQSHALIAKSRGPLEWHALACPFL